MENESTRWYHNYSVEVIIMLQHGIIIITWKWWLRDPMIKLLREDKYHFTIRYHDYHMISLG